MRRLLWLLCCAGVAAGCYDGPFAGRDEPRREPPAATTSLAGLRRLYAGEPVTIRSEVVVAGRVTADDRGGNFYRSLVIEADGAALELLAGLDLLCNDYPVGTHLTLRLEGLALDERYGVLRAGVPVAAGIDGLASRAALDRHLFRDGRTPEPPEPLTLLASELHPSLCGRLVRLDGLRYAPEEAVAESCWSGYRRFADEAGRFIHTYVRPYAGFASAELPFGRCSLTGILQYDASGNDGAGRYLLKLRDATDVR